jgi:glycine/sarcosine N-methyltransferase
MADTNKDTYEGFADRYDLFFDRVGERDIKVVELFRRIFKENGVKSILDCACGTGNDVLFFYSLGLDVCGSDISKSMLTIANENLIKAGVDIPLSQVDYRELPEHFDRQFDCVVCLATSIAEMPNEDEVLRAFESMRGVLRKGGILVLSQGTTDKQWKEKPRFILAVNTEDFSRLFVIDYIGRGVRYNILDIFHGSQSKEIKVWGIDYPLLLLKDDLERLLQKSGFQLIDAYGNYAFDRYDKEKSNRLIMVAHN